MNADELMLITDNHVSQKFFTRQNTLCLRFWQTLINSKKERKILDMKYFKLVSLLSPYFVGECFREKRGYATGITLTAITTEWQAPCNWWTSQKRIQDETANISIGTELHIVCHISQCPYVMLCFDLTSTVHVVSFKAKGSIYQSFVYTVRSFCLEADDVLIALGTRIIS